MTIIFELPERPHGMRWRVMVQANEVVSDRE